MIRGANPQPGAWTTVAGKRLTVLDSSKSDNTDGDPGTVIAADASGITVAANGGSICISRLKLQGGSKLSAAEMMEQSPLNAGDVLGVD